MPTTPTPSVTSGNHTNLAFQWVLDNAEYVKINRRAIVAQTTARDGTIRRASRGGAVWRITAKMPDGFRYSEVRGYLQALDTSDRIEEGTVKLNNPTWLTEYKGDLSSTDVNALKARRTTAAADATELEISNLPVGSSTAAVFRAGDFIQLENKSAVYSIKYDVLRGTGNTVNAFTHRPIFTTANNSVYHDMVIGNDCEFTVVCTNMPEWTVTPGQLVTWSGEFEFVESLAGQTI